MKKYSEGRMKETQREWDGKENKAVYTSRSRVRVGRSSKKAKRDRPTDRRTDGPTDGQSGL